MTQYFREFFDIYFESLGIMAMQREKGMVINEGIRYVEVEEWQNGNPEK